jgi:reactive intermediate/imine deaminase
VPADDNDKRERMTNQPIHTREAPAAIGTYSQAIRAGNTVYLSGQIPLDPKTMQLVSGDPRAEIKRVFDNLAAVAKAAGGTLDNAVKVNVYLTDLKNFALVNEVMTEYFKEPYPARAAIGVAQLPRGAAVEVDAVLVL